MTQFDKARNDLKDAFTQLHMAAHGTIDLALGKVEDHVLSIIDRAEAKANHPANGTKREGPSKEQMVSDLADVYAEQGNVPLAEAFRRAGTKMPYELLHLSWSRLASGRQGNTGDGSRLMDGLFSTFDKLRDDEPVKKNKDPWNSNTDNVEPPVTPEEEETFPEDPER